MNFEKFTFLLNPSLVAQTIYDGYSHKTTDTGIVISENVGTELVRFLKEFNQFLKIEQTPYYRIDAYFDADSLYILEVNAAFVDGWGTAFNLSRAAGIAIPKEKIDFPGTFYCHEKVYLPEMKLFADELYLLTKKSINIVDEIRTDTPIYIYGRSSVKINTIFPYNGSELDNKLNLALFSKQWKSEVIQIPIHYTHLDTLWENIPTNSVIKFCDKDSAQSKQARCSVLLHKPQGKAQFIKKCYGEGTLIAQQFIMPYKHNNLNHQLIILTAGDNPITGYVQKSTKDVINDNSIHGPLWIK